MTGMADHDDFPALGTHSRNSDMYFGYQWASCIKYHQPARFGFLPYRLRYAVRAEDDNTARRHSCQILHEYHAFLPQIMHDQFVMHHLVPHVNRGAALRKSALDYFDSAVYAGTETTWVSKQQVH
jgi:hypothetical protein